MVKSSELVIYQADNVLGGPELDTNAMSRLLVLSETLAASIASGQSCWVTIRCTNKPDVTFIKALVPMDIDPDAVCDIIGCLDVDSLEEVKGLVLHQPTGIVVYNQLECPESTVVKWLQVKTKPLVFRIQQSMGAYRNPQLN